MSVVSVSTSQDWPEAANSTPTESGVDVSYEYSLSDHVCEFSCPCGCGYDHPADPDVMPGNDESGSSTGTTNPLGTLQTLADYLTEGFWDDFYGPGREFRFNLSDDGINAKNGVLTYDVDGFTGYGGGDSDGIALDRRDLVRDVMDAYSELLGIEFVEVSGTNGGADIYFSDAYSGAYAFSSTDYGFIDYSFINVAESWYGGQDGISSYTTQTIFHEVGHALGLGHQGSYNAGNGSPTYGDATWANDTWQHTMMSYWSQPNYNDATYSFLFGPMAVDFIALNDLYNQDGFGTQHAFNGDTTFGFNTNISSANNALWSQLAVYADDMAFTIADGSGEDTVDFSGYSATQLIDLRASDPNLTELFASDIGGRIGNMVIAAGTVIENAIGGSGRDTFIGNDADNELDGRDGNDVFIESAGNDIYRGGEGFDEVSFAESIGAFVINAFDDFVELVSDTVDRVFDDIEAFLFDGVSYEYSEVVEMAASDPPPPPNEDPTARNDAFLTDEGSSVGGNLLSDNGNGADSDPDGGTLSVISVEGETDGSVTLASGAIVSFASDGTFSYDPNGAFDDLFDGDEASDSFDYEISDGQGGTASATASVTIAGAGTPPPEKTQVVFDFEDQPEGTYTGDHGIGFQELRVDERNALGGDYAGKSYKAGDMSFFALDDADTFDFDSFLIRTTSSKNSTDVVVSAYLDDELVGTQSFTTLVGTGLLVELSSDFDNIDRVEINADAKIIVDELTFGIDDDPPPPPNEDPTARNDAFLTDEGSSVGGNLLSDNGNGADSDPDGGTLSVISVEGETDGSVTLASGAIVTFASDGTFSYDPNGAFDDLFDGDEASDSFDYEISDGQGGTASATASVTIAGAGTPPPEKTQVVFDFEDQPEGTYTGDHGIGFQELRVDERNALGGDYAGKSYKAGDMSFFALDDADTFDFDSFLIRTTSSKNSTDVVVSAYLDDELVGTQSFTTLVGTGLLVELSSDFDNIDRVEIDADAKIIVDELEFMI